MIENYPHFDPPYEQDVRTLTPGQAKDYFAWFQARIPERLSILMRVMTVSPDAPKQLDFNEASIQKLGAWLCWNVSAHAFTALEKERMLATLPAWMHDSAPDYELSEEAASLCADIGIFFGECLRSNHSNLRWELVTKPKIDADLNQPVIRGFSTGTQVNPIAIVAVVAGKALDGRATEDSLSSVYRFWDALASK